MDLLKQVGLQPADTFSEALTQHLAAAGWSSAVALNTRDSSSADSSPSAGSQSSLPASDAARPVVGADVGAGAGAASYASSDAAPVLGASESKSPAVAAPAATVGALARWAASQFALLPRDCLARDLVVEYEYQADHSVGLAAVSMRSLTSCCFPGLLTDHWSRRICL